MEGAIHTASELFETSDESHGMLMIDATNAFNSINRVSLLWNVRVLWPRASRFIFNTYRGWAPLVVRGSRDVLFSRQGDPLSMFLCAIATLPLIEQTQLNSIKQLWYADDASAIGSLPSFLLWFKKLQRVGPSFGYFPEPSKCSFIVKVSMVDHASSMFEGTGVKVVTSCRFLGGVIGDHSGKVSFVMQKVREWSHSVQLLASVSKQQPQAAFIGFIKSLQLEWTFLQRVVSDCSSLLIDIEDTIISDFIPSLFGHDCNSLDRQLFSLPLRMGGLGILIPSSDSTLLFDTFRSATHVLRVAITESLPSTLQTMTARSYKLGLTTYISAKKNRDKQLLSSLLDQCDPVRQRSLLRHQKSLSCWLNVLPVQRDRFNLSAVDFCDSLCLRYMKPLLNLPASCDGCGAPFTTSHALDCRKGGLIIQRHNEIRDLLFDLISLVWSHQVKEPIVNEDTSCALVADIAARGVWQPQVTTLFDIRVFSDAPSYLQKPTITVLKSAEREKKLKYNSDCERRHASFTPLCVTIDGVLTPEMAQFVKHLATRLSLKWDLNYSTVLY